MSREKKRSLGPLRKLEDFFDVISPQEEKL